MNNNRSPQKNNQAPAEKPLPRSQEGERLVLGIILLDYRTHAHQIDKLSTDAFPLERDKNIFRALTSLRVAGTAIDPVTVHDELHKAGHLTIALSDLYGLTEGMPLLPNVDSWVALLNEKANLRRILQQGPYVEGLVASGFSSAEIIQSNQRVAEDIQKRTLAKPMMAGMTSDELVEASIERPSMALEGLLEKNALNMIYGAQKSGKTLLTSQIAIAIAAGQKTLFGWYRINIEGPVMFIQADDRNRGASMKEILVRSPVRVRGMPFHAIVECGLALGDAFYGWLEGEIKSKGLVFVAMDSWTALRAERHGGDIVKAEEAELGALSDLAQRAGCTFGLIHHESQGSRRNSFHWTDRAGGTFAVTAKPAIQIQVSRFQELDDKAPERLVRARGRHTGGETFVMRFQEATLDHELIMAGSAAEFYPLLEKLKSEFGKNAFKPKDVISATGLGRTTAHKQIETLRRAGEITKIRFGEYMVGGNAP